MAPGIDPIIAWSARMGRRLRLAGLSRRVRPVRGRPLVVGFLGAPSGVGAGARLMLKALSESGLRPAAADVTGRFFPGSRPLDWEVGQDIGRDDGRGPVIVHVNAPEVPDVLSGITRRRLEGRLRIAYWAWEFEAIPVGWAKELCFFHECWAPSAFTARAIRACRPDITVRSVGYPIVSSALSAARSAEWRRKLAPDGQWLCLHAFDARSSMDRKNPLGAIEIFQQACVNRQDVRLVLKVTSWDWSPTTRSRILERVAKDGRIVLITEMLSDDDMAALVSAADIYLSPHRSEGFGLVLAGALLAGAEVLMTNWSGNLDFADLPGAHRLPCSLVQAEDTSGVYAKIPGLWAEPDIPAAVSVLQAIVQEARVDSPERRSLIAAAAARRFSPEAWLGRLGQGFRTHVSGWESGDGSSDAAG